MGKIKEEFLSSFRPTVGRLLADRSFGELFFNFTGTCGFVVCQSVYDFVVVVYFISLEGKDCECYLLNI